MSDIIEIKSGELYIHGNHIPRHEEKPWLFSASAVHKALEEVIRKKARRLKKDEVKYLENTHPFFWMKNNFKVEGYVEKIANRTRNRIHRFGSTVGFGFKLDSRIQFDLDEYEDKELVYAGIRGRSKNAGSYLCQHAVVDYTASIDADFRHELIDLFTQVVNGNVEEVVEKVVENNKKAKGTPERQEHKEQNYRLTKACGDKHLLPIHPQKGINLATLGMTAKKYKEKTGATEPLNDNLPVGLVRERAVAVEMTAKAIEDNPSAKISPKEGVKIGFKCGVMAKQVLVDREAQELLFRNGLRSSKHARAVAKKYGLL